VHLGAQFLDRGLLFLDRVKHRPDYRVVVDEAVAVFGFCNGFWNYLLNRLGAKANVFTV